MISIIIPAYNEEQSIGTCLGALTKQDVRESFEVIVVDNASTDRTAEIARSFTGKLNLRILQEKKKGRGAARRAGFAAAKGEIILSTDADCEPPPEWVSMLTHTLHAHPDLAAVTTPPEIRGRSKLQNAILSLQPIVMWIYRIFWGHFWLNGCSFAIRREAYNVAGGFDPHADAQEDSELSRRVHRYGNIRLLRQPRMVTSGRRFQKTGLLRGLFAYFSSFVAVRVSRGQKRAELSDVR